MMAENPERRTLDRLLVVFADVRAGEGLTALLLALNIFLILMSYYVLKPVREALILGEGSAELKTYMSAGQVVALAIVVPYYGRLVAQFSRIRLINVVTAFFLVCLLFFYVLAQFGVPLAVAFFLWIGVFNMMIVAQFWSFANDIYSKEQGERLFAIVGFGASLGAVVGSSAADSLVEPLGVNQLMLVGAVILFAQLIVTNVVDRWESARAIAPPVARDSTGANKGGAFGLVFRTRYLLLMALLLMLLNWVNTTGEYILGSIVKDTASDMIRTGRSGGLTEGQLIADFYSKFFTLVNATGLLLQLFVVSRIVKYWGVPWAVMVLPAVSLGAYGVMAFAPVMLAVLGAKVAENSLNYSLNNTVRNMLFLPCTYEEKFSAKQAIDSFFVRIGDVLSAVLVFVGTVVVQLRPTEFAAVNTAIVVVWLILAWRIGHYYRVRTGTLTTGPEPAKIEARGVA